MFTDKKLGISNQDKLRIEHQKLLYKLFRDGQTYSCADIARATGLSNTAAANIVDALLKYRIVRQSDASGMISMGRPPVLYELNPDYGLVAAIDLTDEDLIVTVSDMKMRILHRSVIPGCVYITAEILNQLVKLLKDFLNGGQTAFQKYSAICIGTPGKISAETGNFIFAPKFVNYKSVNLHKIFSDAFDTLIVIKNDIKLALMGESYFGSAVDKKNVVYLHIDHNYGGAVKSNGKILEGEHGFAGEFGGMRVLNRSEQFRYVSYSVSLGGMVYHWENHYRELGTLKERETTLNVQNFIDLYHEGDPVVVKIAEEAAEATAVEILNTVMLLDATTIILDGKIKELGKRYLEKIEQYLNTYIYDDLRIEVSYSLLQGRATILGGLRCAIDTVTKSILNQTANEDN